MNRDLAQLIQRFNAGTVSPEELQKGCLHLIKSAAYQEMSTQEWKEFEKLFSGWIDRYDRKFQPRKGPFGKLIDILDQIFLSNYRISVDELRERTSEFERRFIAIQRSGYAQESTN